MTRLAVALASAAILTLSACGSNDQDSLENLEENYQADELNALADNAAAEAELEALENQQQQLETAPAAPANDPVVNSDSTDPSQVEEDVQGM